MTASNLFIQLLWPIRTIKQKKNKIQLSIYSSHHSFHNQHISNHNIIFHIIIRSDKSLNDF